VESGVKDATGLSLVLPTVQLNGIGCFKRFYYMTVSEKNPLNFYQKETFVL
jgi:hypothetical protein